MEVRTEKGAPELRAQEYAALRSEILKHIEFRYQITSLAVTLAGAILLSRAQESKAWSGRAAGPAGNGSDESAARLARGAGCRPGS
jgi:hypothetical protein